MIYALCDVRNNRQEIYIGYTDNPTKRLQDHIRDGKVYPNSYRKIQGSKISFKATWINSILHDCQSPKLIVIDQSNKYREGDWIKKFAEKDLVLQNSRIDIENCLTGYGLSGEGTISIKEEDYTTALEIIRTNGLYVEIYPRILIDRYPKEAYIRGQSTVYEFDYYSYPTRTLSKLEEYNFQQEYLKLQHEFEDNESPSIIYTNDLYLMNTEAKKAFIRDYFNNDLLSFLLGKVLSTESDEDDEYLAEDIKLLLNNNTNISKNIMNIIREIMKDDIASKNYSFLSKFCNINSKKLIKKWQNDAIIKPT